MQERGRVAWHFVALLGYFVLASVATFPTILRFTSEVTGSELVADRNQHLWDLWWIGESLSRGANPFHTEMLYHPYGVDLYYHALGLSHGLIGLLPLAILGLPAAYNTVVLAAFALSGYGAFRLGMLFTERALPSFLGGVVFAFTPYMLDALDKGQTEVLSAQWIPFYVEAWLRGVGAGRWRHMLLAGVFLALAAYGSLYYAAYLVLFSLVHIAYTLITTRERPSENPAQRINSRATTRQSPPARTGRYSPRRGTLLNAAREFIRWAGRRSSSQTVAEWSAILRSVLKCSAVVGCVGLALTLPLAVGLAANYNNPRLEVLAGESHMLGHSADLLGLFALPSDHPLLAGGVEGESLEDYVALGYVALGLALVGGITSWKRREVKFWAVLGVIALVLALGPQLQVGSVVTDVPMPFKLVEGLPGMGAIGKVSRFLVITRLCMAVLAVLGAAWLMARLDARLSGPLRMALPFTALLALLLVELPLHQRDTQPLNIPAGMSRLAGQGAGGAIMELPFATRRVEPSGERMLYQTAHARPIMGGYLSRTYNSPVVSSCSPFWGFISPSDVPAPGADIITPAVTSRLPDVLSFYNIEYVALYNTYGGPRADPLAPGEREALQGVISRVSNGAPLSSDAEVSIYKVGGRDLQAAVPSLHVGSGWYDIEEVGGAPFRWVKDDEATLCVFSPRRVTASLVFEGTAFAQERSARIRVGSGTYADRLFPAGGSFARVTIGPQEWQPGVTEVYIEKSEQGLTPRSVDANLQDDRVLTVGIRGVYLEIDGEK